MGASSHFCEVRVKLPLACCFATLFFFNITRFVFFSCESPTPALLLETANKFTAARVSFRQKVVKAVTPDALRFLSF
jgi:hypothetical protein